MAEDSMSIFVAIPSLIDLELPYTIMSAMQNADNPKEITVGVSAFMDKNFYNDVLYKINGLKNVIVDRYDPEQSQGVGQARILSQLRYSGQDNILQCDAHVYFEKGWDTKLKELWTEAAEETNNEKTLLTAYLPSYKRRNGKLYIKDNIARYSKFEQRNDLDFHNIIPWTDMPLNEFPQKIEKKFVPAQKISGSFVFSNHHYVEKNDHLKSVKFFDEEIIHYYWIDLDDRFRQIATWTGEEQDHSMNIYTQNNDWKCRLWEQYAHVNIVNRSFEEWYVPINYR
jgi:hypothetical protein